MFKLKDKCFSQAITACTFKVLLAKTLQKGGHACQRRLLEDQSSFSYTDFIKYYSQFQTELL